MLSNVGGNITCSILTKKMEDQAKFCEKCKRVIEHNVDLHMLRCKNICKLCIICKEPVPMNDIKEHMESMHVIKLCEFCKKPYENWELEKHKNDCSKKPVICKFCNLDVAEDDFKEHAEMCWNRTEKCPTCTQYVKLKDLETHKITCKNPSLRSFVACKFCGDCVSLHVIDTHESVCGDKNTRCPDCGELIKKHGRNHVCKRKKNSVSVQSEEQKEVFDVSTRSNYHGPKSFPMEPEKNQAVEISPPVQRDMSDSKFDRAFREKDSFEDPIIQTQDCPLCSKAFPVDRFNDHVRACAEGKNFCSFCKNNFFGDFKEHLKQCSKMEPELKKDSKKTAKKEKKEGLLQRGLKFFSAGPKKYGKVNSIPNFNPEDQFVVDGIPCEFCGEVFPFEEIAVHELCMHEEDIKLRDSVRMPKDEAPQASGFTYDPRDYMPSHSYEDKEPRNLRVSQESPKLSEFSKHRNSHNLRSNVNEDDFYEKHLVKDHRKDISAGKSQRELKKAVEEGRKEEDVLFAYSADKKSKFPVKESRKLDQGARPKFQIKEHLSVKHPGQKVMNCLSDSDEETDLYLSEVKEKEKRKEGSLNTIICDDRKLNAIGYEQKEKKSCNELEKNNSNIYIGNYKDFRSSLEDAPSSVRKKKGSFNSESSEEMYVSCDEGEEETKHLNEGKGLKNTRQRKVCTEKDEVHEISMDDLKKYVKEYNDTRVSENDKKQVNSSNEKAKQSKGRVLEISASDLVLKEAKISESEERNEKIHSFSEEMYARKYSQSGKEGKLQGCRTSLKVLDEYFCEIGNSVNPSKSMDEITSKSSAFLTHQETHSLLHELVVDDDVDMESEADKKNEETFSSPFNPFNAMTSGQFSYETGSNLPQYSSIDSDHNNGAEDDCLDAYLQFLGVSNPEPDDNYSGQAYKAEPDSSYVCLRNDQLNANCAPEPKMVVTFPQEPVQEFTGVSKPTYTSPFLLENEDARRVGRTERKFPVTLEEKKRFQTTGKSTIDKKIKSQEEKDNELNCRRLNWGLSSDSQ